jgi:hypothetical protein
VQEQLVALIEATQTQRSIDPLLHLATLKSISHARSGTVKMTSIARPTIPAGIDLCPFVEELWHGENADEAFKGLPYLASALSTKIEDHQAGTVYKREPAFVEVVAIAGDKDPAKAQASAAWFSSGCPLRRMDGSK